MNRFEDQATDRMANYLLTCHRDNHVVGIRTRSGMMSSGRVAGIEDYVLFLKDQHDHTEAIRIDHIESILCQPKDA